MNTVYRISYTAPEAKILVVDDNSMNRMVFAAILQPTQMQIFETESGIETLHLIKENRLCEGVPIIVSMANAIIGEMQEEVILELAPWIEKCFEEEDVFTICGI